MSKLKCTDDSWEFNTQFISQRSTVDFYVPTDGGYILVWVFDKEKSTHFQFIKDGILYLRMVNRAYGPSGVSRMAKRWYHEVLEGA